MAGDQLYLPFVAREASERNAREKRRVNSLEAKEPAPSNTGYQPIDVLESKTHGQLFNAGDSSTPSGWTFTDAAYASTQNTVDGYWDIAASDGNRTWSVQKQLSVTGAEYAAGCSVVFNQVAHRSMPISYSTDITYTFALHADNSGSPSTTNLNSLEWQYHSDSGQYRVRQRCLTAGVENVSNWQPFGWLIPQPFFVRLMVSHIGAASSNYRRTYVGFSTLLYADTMLNNLQTGTVNYENMWVVMSRDSASTDYDHLMLSGIDVKPIY